MSPSAIPSTAPPLPVPERDRDSAPFWDALREHRLRLQSCDACERVRFPAMSRCPYCVAPEHRWRELSGRGRIYSWIVVRQAFRPEFAAEVPYALVTVDLEEGVRVVGRMDDVDSPAFDLAVVAAYVDHPEWTELRFEEMAA
ncbi:Zn-ribbon domain-containing OB-fold protein [Streptomyces abyssomicinicus]|uniref:Zn-ribbon domain-containing OB-fold protein n=1 Tax=Streptomyces abyssomicinicus TaxID=574929 RepID=UPI001250A081|nr:OB-fold domain-containing protein [Streptomyces abyssomicinicus]